MLERITNKPVDYAWGTIDGISSLLKQPATGAREAELWLGAHPGSPTQFAEHATLSDLACWEQQSGLRLPFLLKILAAAMPLSIQVHPNAMQARAGYDAEQKADRLSSLVPNYADPCAKPELVVALESGFEALVGVRESAESLRSIEVLAQLLDTSPGDPVTKDLALLGTTIAQGGSAAGLRLLLSGNPAGARLARAITSALPTLASRHPLLSALASAHPNDVGLLIGLLMNHVRLEKHESLWVDAGTLHAYVRGRVMELMGPSDNVLRAGLTKKNLAPDELLSIAHLDFEPPFYLDAVDIARNRRLYQPPAPPAEAPFALELISGDCRAASAGPSIFACIDGEFELSATGTGTGAGAGRRIGAGDFFLSTEAQIDVTGSGTLFRAISR